ncbi:MAG: TIGR04283 family arsenosugar biosynthesis glycosyltransferase [Stenotrophobium sp.]
MDGALAVIIPTLNEAANLPRLLAQLRAQTLVPLEIIVADGGSGDDTVPLARAAGASIVHSARGRARQMNAAAAQARSRWLLFLHADSTLHDRTQLATALTQLVAAERDGLCAAGHWPLHFHDAPDGARTFYAHLEAKSALNRAGTINGDQGLLISAEFFRALGGYDESLPFLEDQRIAAKIFAQGRWLPLPGRLGTSARRFECEGRRARYTLMALIMGLHAAGVNEFFAQAPAVYAAQHDTTQLDLRPFLRLIRRVLWQRGPFGALAVLWRASRYIRGEAWQIAWWRDHRHGDTTLPRLRFFDRRLAPLLRNPLADAITLLLFCLWFFVWLPLPQK